MSKKVGSIVRKIRKEKGISLRELAKQVGVSFVNISYIENGRIETSKEVLRRISKALDYDFDKLLSATDLIDDDLTKIINKKPNLVPEFLRIAKNLSSDDWKKLIRKLKKNEKI
tara:strand:- start:882 stop:1223 length:342 start_codon:yes stop_codon:yes gene_type:complete